MMKLHITDWREASNAVRVLNLSAQGGRRQSAETLFVGAATESPSTEANEWQMGSSALGYRQRTTLRVFAQTELMTAGEIHLLRQSLNLLSPLADVLVEAFYHRLFDLEPDLDSIMHRDRATPARQVRKLMQRLSALIGMLDRPHALVSTLECLRREQTYCGVSEEHYDKFAEALLWTLERGLGPAFTPEVDAAWTTFCRLVITLMQNAPNDETTHFELAEAVAC